MRTNEAAKIAKINTTYLGAERDKCREYGWGFLQLSQYFALPINIQQLYYTPHYRYK
jgi:hypothetical protein